MNEWPFSLITGRTVYQGVGKEKGKLSTEYEESVALCEIDPKDMDSLNIKEHSPIKVTTEYGSVVVQAVKSLRTPHSKIIFMPYGPWASLVMNPETDGTGMPSLKGIPAQVESTAEKVLDVLEILENFYRK